MSYKVKKEYIDILDNDEKEDSHLSILEEDFKKKAINIAGYIKNLEHKIQIQKQYENEIREKRRVNENKASRLKKYIKEQMAILNIDKINGIEFNISKYTIANSINLVNENEVNEEFKITKKVVNKALILNYIKETGDIPEGVNYVKNEALRIK